jgi:hypothetical protein
MLRDEHRLRIFENRLKRGNMWTQKGERKRCWRKMHNEELHDTYSSPNIIPDGLMKSMKILRWPGHMAHTREKRDADRVCLEHTKEIHYLEDLSVDGSNIKIDFKDTG